ncbi:EAL domain-containing protein [Enterobacteriaceae bacterium H11S18]|uniref:EAL domain-containing protein n=1 Tax=Dryocola clanedunensis TaxID=2925396 RepID=UPI0022F088F5|nr:EAL domain-containing protein [Dryocola clanedunensis]MCT4708866.1 EAL domain-containing protein [Dryocola clanedunensis]
MVSAEIKNLPVNSLKIDRAFISGLPHDQVDVAIIKTIVNLGHALGYKLVADVDFESYCDCDDHLQGNFKVVRP